MNAITVAAAFALAMASPLMAQSTDHEGACLQCSPDGKFEARFLHDRAKDILKVSVRFPRNHRAHLAFDPALSKQSPPEQRIVVMIDDSDLCSSVNGSARFCGADARIDHKVSGTMTSTTVDLDLPMAEVAFDPSTPLVAVQVNFFDSTGAIIVGNIWNLLGVREGSDLEVLR